MRRSVVRLIAAREVRDLIRDRRTLMIVLGLPAVLYPAFVVVGLAFAVSMMDQKTVIGGVEGGSKPEVHILGRDGDETSKLAVARVGAVVGRWRDRVKAVRFVRRGLPADFDEPVAIIDPEDAKPAETRTADELRDVLVKFLPFLLVMWTMAGALHPAIDLTAGEKE